MNIIICHQLPRFEFVVIHKTQCRKSMASQLNVGFKLACLNVLKQCFIFNYKVCSYNKLNDENMAD